MIVAAGRDGASVSRYYSRMSGRIVWDKSGFSRSPLVWPIGSSWEGIDVDQKVIAGYRFFDKSRTNDIHYAALKTRLDIAAAIYLFFVLVGALLQGPVASLSGLLTYTSRAFSLQPFLPAHLAHSRAGFAIPFVIFLAVGYCVLLHESRWLNERIYIYRPYAGFTSSKDKDVIPRSQFVLTLTSRIINHMMAAGLIFTAAAYLWNLRFVSWTRNPYEIPALLLSGVMLAVVGISKAIDAMESDDAETWLLFLEVSAAAILVGASFAAVIALGLRRGPSGAITGFCFGAAMGFSAWMFRHFIVRPNQKHLPPSIEPWIRRFVFLPLMAMGRIIDAVLAFVLQYIVHPIQVWLIALFKPLLRLFANALGKLPYRYVRGPLHWANSYLDQPPPLSKLEMTDTFVEAGRTEDGRVYGYAHPAQTPPPPTGIVVRYRSSLLSGLLAEDSWLTRWLKREPIRLLRTRTSWEREDPLDFKRRVRHDVGIWPPTEDLDYLSRRLLSLMLATYFIAYIVELAVGHIVAYAGKPLLDRGPLYATLFGLAVGALFALAGILGHSSISVLTLGLVSGLALDPTLGLAGGLAYRVGHDGFLFVITFVLSLLTDTQQKRSLFIVGIVIAAAGVYLQYLPHLIKP